MTKPLWTYTSDSCGYTLFLDGQQKEGARTLGTATHTSDGRRRNPKAIKADRKMHAETAARICAERNKETT